jgi:HAMP domain-containing protein
MLFDFLVGYIPSGIDVGGAFSQLYLNWQIGNGLSGFIPGIMALYHRRYWSIRDHLHALVYMVLGVAIGMGFPAFTDVLIYPDFPFEVALNDTFIPIFGHNMLSTLLFVPLMLFNFERIDIGYIRSGQWSRSGLLRRLLLIIIVSAALPTLLLSFFLIQQDGQVQQLNATLQTLTSSLESAPTENTGTELTYKLIIAIGITLAFTVVNAMLASQSISRPLLNLADSARAMKSGRLTLEQATELKNSKGSDEIAELSSQFGGMATEVIAREEMLKRQVESLKIEVDLAKQQKQVSEITDSDFFRDLQGKARTLRQRERTPVAIPEASDAEETHPPRMNDALLAAIDESESRSAD